ncbi:MAG: restriction endonuclease [Candidatus Thorarchaeota archaeon]
MTESNRTTLKEWLAKNARDDPIHYRDIAEEMGRDPRSVSASLSIEKRNAQEENRPAYFVRVAPGLYRYNDLCEGAIDEELISEVSSRAEDFNKATRAKIRKRIAELSFEGFVELAKIVMVNIRARVEHDEELSPVERYDNTVVFLNSWRDDSGESTVVFHVKKCNLNEEIGPDTIQKIRGMLPKYKANQGVLITNGVVNEEGRDEALGYEPGGCKISVPPVHLMDIEIILNVLIESRTGVKSRKVEVLLLDENFFDTLAK